MDIRQTGNNEAVNYTPQYTIPNYQKDGKFLDLMSNSMGLLIKAFADNQIMQGEMATVNNYVSGKPAIWPTTPEESGSVLYDGAAAALFVSAQIGIASNIMAGITKAKQDLNQSFESSFKLITG